MNALQGFDMLHDSLVQGIAAAANRRVAVRNAAAGLVRDARERSAYERGLCAIIEELRLIANSRSAEIVRLNKIIRDLKGE